MIIGIRWEECQIIYQTTSNTFLDFVPISCISTVSCNYTLNQCLRNKLQYYTIDSSVTIIQDNEYNTIIWHFDVLPFYSFHSSLFFYFSVIMTVPITHCNWQYKTTNKIIYYMRFLFIANKMVSRGRQY